MHTLGLPLEGVASIFTEFSSQWKVFTDTPLRLRSFSSSPSPPVPSSPCLGHCKKCWSNLIPSSLFKQTPNRVDRTFGKYVENDPEKLLAVGRSSFKPEGKHPGLSRLLDLCRFFRVSRSVGRWTTMKALKGDQSIWISARFYSVLASNASNDCSVLKSIW